MKYKVKAGDTLSKIARRNGMTLAKLLKANPQISNPNKIKVGDSVNVPDATSDSSQPPPTKKPEPQVVTTAAGAIGAALTDLLGTLSAKYETGGRGPGTVSSGVGDPGGVSYGSYQMATKMGTASRFVTQAGFPWLIDFRNLKAGSAPFTACWKRIAKAQPDDFQRAQHGYIKQTHYDLLVNKIFNEDTLDVNTRSRALQDVIWSTAVQHGGATPIPHRAFVKVTVARTDASFDEAYIRAVYAERGRKKADGKLVYFSKSSASVQRGVAKRFQNELADALAMLAKDA